MDLVERYLAAIRRDLPVAKADDILAELRDELLTRIEAREESLGRPLGKPELAQVLREMGRPIVVATRYREHQYLIGPATFPLYVGGLKFAGLIVGILAAVLIGVDLAFGSQDLARAAMQATSTIMTMLLTAFGIVTLIFALIERNGGWKGDGDWVDALPSLDDLARDSRKDAPLEIVFGALFLLWWFGVIPIPPTGWQQFEVSFAPVLDQLFWPIAVVVAARLVMSLLALGPARLEGLRQLLNVATAVAGIVLVALLYQAGHWVEVVPGAGWPGDAARVEDSINLSIRIGLVVSAIAWSIATLGFGWKLLRRQGTVS